MLIIAQPYDVRKSGTANKLRQATKKIIALEDKNVKCIKWERDRCEVLADISKGEMLLREMSRDEGIIY